jgi:transposase-like protein
MDWETLYCPHRHCRDDGKPCTQGYVVQNGTSRGQPRAWCTACAGRVVLRYGPAYDGLDAAPAIFETAVRALAEDKALRATARSVHVDKDTVCAWRHRVACHCRIVMRYVWHDRPVSECQLDALWSGVPTQEAHLPGAQIDCETSGDAWVWIALAPVWRVVLAFVIGTRDQAGADVLLARVAQVTDDCMPLCTSAQLPASRHALRHTSGAWYQPQRQGSRGAYPQPRRRPPPSLRYAQVVKRREGGRMVHVSPRVVCGTPEAVAARWAHAPVSSTVNTSLVERDNRTQRQSHRRLTWRTHGCSKDLTWCEKPLWLSLAYDHRVLPHQSLRERLPTPEPTRGAGSPRPWRPVTQRGPRV